MVLQFSLKCRFVEYQIAIFKYEYSQIIAVSLSFRNRMYKEFSGGLAVKDLTLSHCGSGRCSAVAHV